MSDHAHYIDLLAQRADALQARGHLYQQFRYLHRQEQDFFRQVQNAYVGIQPLVHSNAHVLSVIQSFRQEHDSFCVQLSELRLELARINAEIQEAIFRMPDRGLLAASD